MVNDDASITQPVPATQGTSATVSRQPRQMNPLGKYASYTYQITLYMITPDAYDAFVQTGRQRINIFNSQTGEGGAFIVAQSGGIENPNQRLMPLDYYIDNLKIESVFTSPLNKTPVIDHDFTFQITEPYGFSFMTRLRMASDYIQNYVAKNNISQGSIQNAINKGGTSESSAISGMLGSNAVALRNFYILGIRFYGWDAEGNQVKASDQLLGDPAIGTSDSIYERFYDIIFTDFKFKIDGKAVTYNITARPLGVNEVFGLKRGDIREQTTLTGSTVGEQLSTLMNSLSTYEQNLLKDKKADEATTYKVFFMNCPEIEKASINIPNDTDKTRKSTSVANTSENTEASAQKAKVVDYANKTNSFNSGTTILSIIKQIISQSTYLTDAIKQLIPTDEGANPKAQPIPNDNKIIPNWFSVSAEATNARWDKKRNDWVYDIAYYIRRLETPVVPTLAVPNWNNRYYGPDKIYEYWFTGQNSEVLSYEQTFEGGYFINTVLTGLQSGENGGTLAQKVQSQTGQSRSGLLNNAAEPINQYISGITDLNQATAKITILGDPDFLTGFGSNNPNEVNNLDDERNRGIAADTRQIFIEINFKEARDYDTFTGLMSINDNIRMWPYPPEIAEKVKGVSYWVIKVQSEFSKGKFQQVLDLVINDFGVAFKLEGEPITTTAQANTNTTGLVPAPNTGMQQQTSAGDQALSTPAKPVAEQPIQEKTG